MRPSRAGTLRGAIGAFVLILSQFVPLAGVHSDSLAEWSPERLMASMATRTAGSIGFREERHLSHLRTPVVLKGTLSFRAPDQLTKTVRSPRNERTVIKGNTVRIETGGTGIAESHLLSDYPALQALVVAFRAVLTGNLAALRRHFAVSLTGTEKDWTLRLAPKTEVLKKRFSAVTIQGSGKQLASAIFLETSGDRIVFRMFGE